MFCGTYKDQSRLLIIVLVDFISKRNDSCEIREANMKLVNFNGFDKFRKENPKLYISMFHRTSGVTTIIFR